MKKEKIKLKTLSLFIKCWDCGEIALNDDDSVCTGCGSKNTKRLLNEDKIFKRVY